MDEFDKVLDMFRPGMEIYMPGSTAESSVLTQALTRNSACAAGVTFVGCFVPGMNEFDYGGLHDDARVRTFMLPRAMHGSFASGRVDLIPSSYHEAALILAAERYDMAFAHVAPADAAGLCSLGIASDFSPLVWNNAVTRVLLINTAMPTMPRGPRLPLSSADIIIDHEGALVTAAPGPISGELDAIADAVAGLIPDGASIQTGIGGAAGAVLKRLAGRRGLVLRSGMANDDLRILADAGALGDTGHQAGIAYGTTEFYDYLARTDLVEFKTTRVTHDSAALSRYSRFHSINSALEVDLFGQVNVEWQSGRLSSGVGGAPNFTRAALASPEGRAIIAMPATAKRGTISRIVPKLATPVVGLPRTDIDTVVTEFGVGQVRKLGLDRRAEALIAIAAPEFRAELEREWRHMRATF